MKHFHLPLFLLAFSTSLSAQLPYTPFEFPGSIWRENYYDGSAGGGSQGVYTENYQYTVEGDTVINGTSYFKVSVSGYLQYGSGPMSPKFYFDGYAGAIRETPGKAVMFIFQNQTDETFLYSFDLHLGDTIQIYYQSGNIVTVEQIDTVEVCGKARNRYLLHFSDGILVPTYLIEGVGTSAGLIPRFEYFETGARLDCYSNGNCTPCELIVSQGEPAAAAAPVSVFPDPAADAVSLESRDRDWNAIEIFDVQGRLKECLPKSAGHLSLAVSDWTPGMYFVRFHFRNSVQVKRFVKN